MVSRSPPTQLLALERKGTNEQRVFNVAGEVLSIKQVFSAQRSALRIVSQRCGSRYEDHLRREFEEKLRRANSGPHEKPTESGLAVPGLLVHAF